MSEICAVYMNVKAVNVNAPTKAFVPCGKCPECQEMSQHAWQFRLGTELEILRSKGWKIGFCTLTYDDAHLPYFPECLWTNPEEFRKVPCFSYGDIKRFLKSVRNSLYRKFHVKKIRYMVCSEYGSNTQRPHYHAIFAWPPVLDAVQMHSIVCDAWRNGFIFPARPYGGKDSHGYEHLAFEVVDNGYNAAAYAAKYACKDLYYEKLVKDLPLDKKSKLFKHCKAFHSQSKSLGLSLLDGLGDDEKLDLLLKGKSFVGKDKFVSIPLYIRNKILFDIHYVYTPDGRRLVRREANTFFDTHVEEIFEKKRQFYENIVNEACQPSFWLGRDIAKLSAGFTVKKIVQKSQEAENIASAVRDGLRKFNVSACDMASKYLAWYGVPLGKCYSIGDALQWYLRYTNDFDVSDVPLISDFQFYSYVHLFWSWLFNLLMKTRPESKRKIKKKIDRCSDFHKSQE